MSKTNSETLVAYFSRTGEQYGVGVINEGNTSIVAKIIAEKTGADLFEIKVVDDKEYFYRLSELVGWYANACSYFHWKSQINR